MPGKLYIEVVAKSGQTGAVLARGGADPGKPLDSRTEIAKLCTLLNAISSNTIRGVVRVTADDSTPVASTLAVTVAQASFAAGDYIVISPPTGVPVRFTAVLTGTPVNGDNTFLAATSDNATATDLARCINSSYTAQAIGLTASAASAVVTLTLGGVDAFVAGSGSNLTTAAKFLGAGGAGGSGFSFTSPFSGGHDAGYLVTVTAALSGAMANNDTVTIGGVVLTGKTSAPSGQAQFLVGVSAAADGAALIACINAHTSLKGYFLASGGATVSIQLRESGRIGALLTIVKTSTAITLSAANWTPLTTEAWATDMVEYSPGGVIS